MQAYTHALAGIWTERLVRRVTRRRWAQAALLVGIGTATHVVWDDLAGMTFHPKGVQAVRDPVVLAYFVASLVVSVPIVWRWRGAWLGMLGAVVPDMDWVIFRPLSWCGLAPWWHDAWLHDTIRTLPGLAGLHGFLSSTLPDWRLYPLAAVPEAGLAVAMALVLWRRLPEVHGDPGH